MNKQLQLKSTITDIEECHDKNNNRFYKVYVQWDPEKPKVFYAFSTDFNLKSETLQILANSPHQFINQRVLITYQELPNKEGNGTFYRIKEIEI